MSYVLMEKGKNWWHNNGGQDYGIRFSLENEIHPVNPILPLGKLGEIVGNIIECETVYGSWTLMHRYNRCREHLIKMDSNNRDFMSYIYIWLRYSFMR